MQLTLNAIRYLKILYNNALEKNNYIAEELGLDVSYISHLKRRLVKEGYIKRARLILPLSKRVEMRKRYDVDFKDDDITIYITFSDNVLLEEVRPDYERVLSKEIWVKDVKWGKGDINCEIVIDSHDIDIAEDITKKIQKVPYPIAYIGYRIST